MMKVVFTFTVLGALTGWGQAVLSTPAPALDRPTGSFFLSSPALTPPVASTTNPSTNLTTSDVSAALLNLQAAVEQTLPALGEFNNNFDFASVPGSLPASGNFGQNFGRNLSANFARNFGMNLGVNTAPSVAATSAAAVAGPTSIPVLPAGTNVLTRETLGALLVLQSDMERMLPLLSALNGTTNATLILETQTNAVGASAGAP